MINTPCPPKGAPFDPVLFEELSQDLRALDLSQCCFGRWRTTVCGCPMTELALRANHEAMAQPGDPCQLTKSVLYSRYAVPGWAVSVFAEVYDDLIFAADDTLWDRTGLKAGKIDLPLETFRDTALQALKNAWEKREDRIAPGY